MCHCSWKQFWHGTLHITPKVEVQLLKWWVRLHLYAWQHVQPAVGKWLHMFAFSLNRGWASGLWMRNANKQTYTKYKRAASDNILTMIKLGQNCFLWTEVCTCSGHPDERPPWRETTLMKDQPDETLPWCETHPDERPPWWETTLMRDHPGERPP